MDDDPKVRKGFVQKVYSILSVQLLVTAGLASVFMFVEPVKMFVRQHRWLMYVAMGVTMVLYFLLTCFVDCRRTPPMNYICLFAFTIAESCLVGIIVSMYNVDMVIVAFLMTAAVVIGLTIFAWLICCDFTTWGGFLCAAMMVLMVMSIAGIFFRNRLFHLIIASVSVLLFSMYLVYDTQMLMGNHRYSIDPEEYVMGALQLYIDMVQIFLDILRILGLLSLDDD